jgi:HK97 family phage major capsid protein
MTREELEKKVEEIETRAAEKQAKDLEEKRNKSFYEGNFKMNENKVENRTWKDLANAMIEKRALSITSTLGEDAANGIGAVYQFGQLWDLIKQREPLLDMVSYFNGPNFETQVPVLEARPAVPTKVSEGWTDNDPDAMKSADLKVKKLNPETYVGILPITYEAARHSFVALEQRIPGLLAESFRTAMCKVIFDNIFDADKVAAANQIATASASAVSIKDLLDLALKVKDTDVAEPVMVMNQGIYSAIAAADANGYDFVKEELVRNKTVEGVKVILTGKAPAFAGATAGDIVVWCGDLKNVALAIADQIDISPIKKLGDSNTYYQAIMAFAGDVIQPKNVFGLKKASL